MAAKEKSLKICPLMFAGHVLNGVMSDRFSASAIPPPSTLFDSPSQLSRLTIMASSFDSVPILDLSLADNPDTKIAFLADLRHAIIDVGFLYIKNFGVDQAFLD